MTGDPQFAQIYALLEQFLDAGQITLETPVAEASPTPVPNSSGGLPTGVSSWPRASR